VQGILKISIIIPTRNRPKSLENLLLSILQQTRIPDEVIVVDDSDTNETEKLIRDNHRVFLSNGIALEYLRGNRENRSISAARNLGAAESIGEIIFFIDDDVILYKNYIEEILKTYEEYPRVKGVQGYIANEVFAFLNFKGFLLNAVKKIFMLDHVEKNKCTLRWGLTYPYSPDGIIQCEWLHGTNMSFKKEVFASFRFDENLRRRSIGEDVDLTSRIHKHYPHSLFMNPRAKLLHVQTPKKEKVDKYAMYSKIPYLVYLSAKNQKATLKNMVRKSWYLIGLFIVDGMIPLFVSKDVEAFFCLAKSFLSTFTHLGDVKKGDFRFIDSMIQAKRKN
jgi:glycosyltransferase involved in cell wall biosynthesis